MCPHHPVCPDAFAPDRTAARVIDAHPEQGWSRLCNGVIVFDDTGELLPDGSAVAPHRGPAPHHHHRPAPAGGGGCGDGAIPAPVAAYRAAP